MPADPFTMLESDHRQVAKMLKSLADSEPGVDRENLVRQLTVAFETHARFEEEAIYPLVTDVLGAEAETEAEVEHGLARDGLEKLAQLVAAPGFGAAVEMLEAGITHHVEEEEGEMFPKLRAAVDDQMKANLVDELRSAKADAGLPIVDVETATKQELMQLAAEADLDGRSSMTKQELARALTR